MAYNLGAKTWYLNSIKPKFIIMKKIMLGLMFLFAIGTAVKTSAQETQRVKFYYYPSANVYQNVTTNEYWYYDNATSNWVKVNTLPTTIVVEKTPRHIVYYNGPDVWKENATHQKKYKAKKGTEGAEKMKKGQQ